ncbi:hypothetical protein PP600_23755 [Mycobacteroides abscessus]|uniref:Uncharacterized protein n=1 Tax=Mycobacteroides abscessus subsp. bolletii 50594 TaxID=1303024 RepID=A0AB33A8Z7_9MYCO|nr:hypothetical protein [Mycobacteroides abscessus]AGM28222.1 hypothetical protein MASS_1620 [Mycobacteroides abscessus subsp. bolletii 50594]MBN7379575.1 hypothetical protein [Mycobacteroides abscessus subsp. massiliense]MDM2539865.1 hypothetical protein [Mycobacteroides abscessus]MDM2544732.1 hypothetical protein [Mycobacteroides abscessus]BBZ81752.1 hypothetical protein MABM_16680 [Mycobacteroides abscessus]
MQLTIGHLRKAIAHLPDNVPVLTEDGEYGPESDINLYVVHAVRRSGHVYGGGHVGPGLSGCEDIYALLVSHWGQNDDAVDITPKDPDVIDGEIDQTAIEAG